MMVGKEECALGRSIFFLKIMFWKIPEQRVKPPTIQTSGAPLANEGEKHVWG